MENTRILIKIITENESSHKKNKNELKKNNNN